MSASAKVPAPKQDLNSEPAGDEMVAPVAPKTGILPTGLSRAIVIATTMVCLVATPFFFARRYELMAAPRNENAIVFRLDTLTGAVSLCSTAQCTPVSEK